MDIKLACLAVWASAASGFDLNPSPPAPPSPPPYPIAPGWIEANEARTAAASLYNLPTSDPQHPNHFGEMPEKFKDVDEVKGFIKKHADAQTVSATDKWDADTWEKLFAELKVKINRKQQREGGESSGREFGARFRGEGLGARV